MNKEDVKGQKYQSLQEVKKRFYPKSSKREYVKSADAKELGITLAQKSIVRLKVSIADALAKS